MISNTRIFDFIHYQLDKFPKDDMLANKEQGQWKRFSSSQVNELADQLSAGLLRLGISGNDMTVSKQDKIAVISKNCAEWIILDIACQQIGAILCPIYPTTHINELEFILKDAEIKLVFISGQDILDKIDILKSDLQSLQQVFSFDKLPNVDNWEKIITNIRKEEIEKVAALKKSILPEHCATIIYTSGTTGIPKGVMLSHQNIVSNVINAKRSFPFDDNTTWRSLSFLPLNHIFERMVTYIYVASGISIYYAESMDTIAENLKEVKPNMFTTVPRLLEKVYDKVMEKGAEFKGVKKKLFDWSIKLADKYDHDEVGGIWYNVQLAIANKIVFSKWREGLGNNISFIVTGGAACQEGLIRKFTAAKIPIYEGYGPTENSPVISVNCRKAGGTKFGTVGIVLDGQEVKLEEDGEICVKGSSVMMGYYKQPELTAETIIDGWLHTGDIGEWVNDKYLKITDRKKELFKTSGGKYVAPQPIENRMKESPYIEQVMVVGANRKFVAAVIVPSIHNLRYWMNQHHIEFTTNEAAIKNPAVIDFYKKLVDSFNIYFNPVEQVKKFELISSEWTINGGELTPTLKLKRKVILGKYSESIEKIYE